MFLIILLLIFCAILSGIEMAFTKVDRLQIELKRKKGSKRGVLLAEDLEQPAQFLATTVFAYNAVLVVLTIFLSQWLHLYIYPSLADDLYLSILADVSIITTIVIVFVEFLPKVTFQIYPSQALFIFAYPMHALKIICYPIVQLLLKISDKLLRLFGNTPSPNKIRLTQRDLEHFLQSFQTQDEKEFDQEIFNNALETNALTAKDCMVVRSEIQAIELHSSIEALQQKFLDTQHTRLVVYEQNLDNIKGYFHHHFLLKNPSSIREYMFPIHSVPETIPAHELMHRMIKEKINIIRLTNDKKETSGIVVLEDILKPIFGAMENEHDV